MRPAVLALALLLSSCGSSPEGPCPGSARTLEILAPADGDRITTSNVEITVLACNFDLADQIVIRLLAPAETDYAYLMPEGRVSTIRREVPVFPGTTMRLRAQTPDLAVSSATVSIETSSP